ncbi:transglutaminase family protein [Falsigemmobacter intermedius]|uniref:transglutaminase family protein n=1 Tax=Falsigemmobacter intermedius TaxID=1553448 RepID=UPI003F0DF7A3
MKLTVEHVTRYCWDRPVRGVVQSHRLTPALFDGQRVLDWEVSVSDGIRGGRFRDGSGTQIQSWSVQGPVSEVVVTVRGRVETEDLAGVLRGHRESLSPLVWLRETAPTRADVALHKLAHSVEAPDALTLAHGLAGAVAEAIAYQPGVTSARTTAAEALALGAGVCQDHAHALISVARLRDLPARYVNGYLHATEDGSPHEAMHAWAEIWIETLGWVGFDAANRCCPDDRYIRLGCGFDAPDAAPIRGTARGTGTEGMDVRVQVGAAQQ